MGAKSTRCCATDSDPLAEPEARGNVRILRGTVPGSASADLADGAFDCVTMLAVLEHIPDTAAVALAICIYGTEIRVRAEDGLLERRFGKRFEEYKAAVPAYLPFH